MDFLDKVNITDYLEDFFLILKEFHTLGFKDKVFRTNEVE